MLLPELNLVNHFLIAMPSMRDPTFGGAVVYLCEHNERGALGVVINKPTEMNLETLFDRINLKLEIISADYPKTNKLVMFGGPVQDDRGFVLHAPAGNFSSTLKISDEIAFTTSRDVLEAVATGNGPERLLVSIGYAGWGAGQLESELLANTWLTAPADADLLFTAAHEAKYSAALARLGINPAMLSRDAGHA